MWVPAMVGTVPPDSQLHLHAVLLADAELPGSHQGQGAGRALRLPLHLLTLFWAQGKQLSISNTVCW